MNGRRSVVLKVDGKNTQVLATEVAPGRWNWVIRVDGEDPVGCGAPHPSGQAAMNEALDVVRARAREGASVRCLPFEPGSMARHALVRH
jgi:hypothetical protein